MIKAKDIKGARGISLTLFTILNIRAKIDAVKKQIKIILIASLILKNKLNAASNFRSPPPIEFSLKSIIKTMPKLIIRKDINPSKIEKFLQ